MLKRRVLIKDTRKTAMPSGQNTTISDQRYVRVHTHIYGIEDGRNQYVKQVCGWGEGVEGVEQGS